MQTKNIVYLWPFQVLSILGIIYSLFVFDWLDILLFLFVGHFIACVGELIGMHRYFSHHSFSVNKFWHTFLVIVSTLAISGPIVAWASIHRNHHKHSDTENDPHSPVHRGIKNVFFANWWYYRHTTPLSIIDYNKDPLLKFTCDYYYQINVAYILVLLIINPYLLFPLYFYPGIIGSIMSSTVNTYLHDSGEVKDSKLLSWIICGDGYHKYHHENPGLAILPSPDACGLIINMIKKS